MQSSVINFGLAQIVSTGNHMTSLVTKHVYVYCILDNVFGSPIFAFHDFPFKMFTCRGRPAWPCEIKKIDRSHCPAYTETKMDFKFLIMLLWLLDLKNGEKLSCTPSISSSSTSHANAEHQRQHFPHLQLASPLCLAGFRMISDFDKLAWSADDLLMSGLLLPAMPVPQPTAKPFAPSSRAPATGLRKMSWSEAVQIFADIKLETSRNHMSFHLDLLKSVGKLAGENLSNAHLQDWNRIPKKLSKRGLHEKIMEFN